MPNTKLQNLLFILVAVCGGLSTLNAQVRTTNDPSQQKVRVIHADVLEVDQSEKMQRMRGNVELRQDSIFLYCDSATIKDDVYVRAYDNVVIQQSDTTSVFSEQLFYDGRLQLARLEQDVVLVNGAQRLFTEKLIYDLQTRVATYPVPGLLDNGRSQLSSKRGRYAMATDNAYFQDSVVVVDSNFTLRTDSLRFNTRLETAYFLAPTRISQHDAVIYCERGKYDIPNQLAVFEKNAQYERDTTRAKAERMQYNGKKREIMLRGQAVVRRPDLFAYADSIRYNELTEVYTLEGNAIFEKDERLVRGRRIVYDAIADSYRTEGRSYLGDSTQVIEADFLNYNTLTGKGIAQGMVIWQDTVQNIGIMAEDVFIDEECQRLSAPGQRPVFFSIDDRLDTLYVAADTLLSFADCDSNADNRSLLAYHDVRIYKADLQGKADSLTYLTVDSQFVLYGDPMIWADTSQFQADTIIIQMKGGEIDRIYLRQNALVLNSPDLQYFNQIRGRNMTVFMRDNKPQKLKVEGSAEAIYYILDETGAYIGPNKTVSSSLWIHFLDGKISNIKLYRQPKGETIPMPLANHETLKLKGFKWESHCRPTSFGDLRRIDFCQ